LSTTSRPAQANTRDMTIVRDSDEVFEMRVSECLWARTFIKANAGDLGFKLICYADYITAEAFNPNIGPGSTATRLCGLTLDWNTPEKCWKRSKG